MRFTSILCIYIMALGLGACNNDNRVEFKPFDEAHRNITGPISDYNLRDYKTSPSFDFSYIDKEYPGSAICFKGSYSEPLGGVPESVAEGKQIIPGRRYSSNGGNFMGIVTKDTIYTFVSAPPAGNLNLQCKNRNSRNFVPRIGKCFYTANAIGQSYAADSSKNHGSSSLNLVMNIIADCPEWSFQEK